MAHHLIKTVHYLQYRASQYANLIVAMFRFLAVVYPVSSLTTRTVANVKYLILATWLLILLSNIPLWLTHSILKVDNSESPIVLW